MNYIQHSRNLLNIITSKHISLTRDVRFFSSSFGKFYDVVVIGGGIVGAASAREILLRNPKLKIAIVEKEKELASHQSGHNSGVVHAGIYYLPGSLKAKLCVEGMSLSYKYFDEKKIPYKKCGKLIVAVTVPEIDRLMNLYDRALKNKVQDVKLIDGSQIKDYEPYCNGYKAIWSPHTGIVDWGLVTHYYAKDFKNAGGEIYLDFEVDEFNGCVFDSNYPVTIRSKDEKEVHARYVLTCAGLYSDKIAKKTGCKGVPKIIPFRGEYLLLNPGKAHLINGNIYPVPDPRFPFLGVHFTPRMDGSVWLGPNAVLAFRREGYRWYNLNIPELFDTLTFPGFIKMASKFVIPGMLEMVRSGLKSLQVQKLQAYIPDISTSDVKPGPAGVRAQALDNDGKLVDDFVFDMGEDGLAKNILHVRNAPSPAATSSLAIAKMIADRMEEQFHLKSINA